MAYDKLLLTILICGCAASHQTASVRDVEPVTASSTQSSSVLTKQLLDEAYDAYLNRNPISASMRGERAFDKRVPDLSSEARNTYFAGLESRMGRARELLNRSDLDPNDRLSLELLLAKGDDAITLRDFHREEQRLTQLNGLQTWLMQLTRRLPIQTPQERGDYLVRLAYLGEMIQEEIKLLRRGLERGNTPPRVVLEGVEDQVSSMLTRTHRTEPLEHPLLSPFKREGASESERTEAIEIFQRTLIPALEEFQNFVITSYIPNARTSIAATDLPDGQRLYRALIQHYTTKSLEAETIHQLGLAEVERIKKQMFAVIEDLEWRIDLADQPDERFREFLVHLRSSPEFYFENSSSMMREYAVIGKEIDLYLPRLFRTLPRLPYGFEEMDASIAERAPTAYYYSGSLENAKPGKFIVNTSKLSERPKYEMRALALHEAVPGHHFQIALAQELAASGLHPWRETLSFTAFVEGWALYAEQLGYDLGADSCGIYCNPYDQFGQLSYEMWRAIRLVVDTGIHAKGWSREKAVAFMLNNSSASPHNARAEIDRYVAWPGQALAYKLGELEINKLRREAMSKLGDAFDIRAFHDQVLSRGALPLGLLRRYVQLWMNSSDQGSSMTP